MTILYILVFILSVLLISLFYNLLRIAVKRIIMMKRIKHACYKNNCLLFKYNKLYMFSKNSSLKYDFTIEKNDVLYNVKLFSTLKNISWVNFRENGMYQTCREYRILRRWRQDSTYNSRLKSIKILTQTKLNENSIQVLLMCPVSKYEIRYTKDNLSQIIG